MTTITKQNGQRQLAFDPERLTRFIHQAAADYPEIKGLDEYTARVLRVISSKETYKAEQITNLLLMDAAQRIGTEEGQDPAWTFIASNLYLKTLYKQASRNRGFDAAQEYGDFYVLIRTLTEKGIYSPELLRAYPKEEINQIGQMIDKSRDRLFTYIGLHTLASRYLATDHAKNVFELPQERWLVIAMTLMQNETENRLEKVAEAYWAMSNLYMTVATPTMSNAGKSISQMSSCFIDTVDDSLRGIYDSNTDIATLSKAGGGINVPVPFGGDVSRKPA